MMKEGLRMSVADLAVFYKYSNESLQGFLAVHIDFYLSNIEHFERTVIAKLRSTFKVGKEKREVFTYVGLSVNQDKDGKALNQDKYISNLKKMQVPIKDNKEDYLNIKDLENLRFKLRHLDLWPN